MWPSNSELIALSNSLGLPIKGNEEEWELQEWEWDFADPAKVGDFLLAYEQTPFKDSQRTALMALIVESYNEFLFSNPHNPALWKRIQNHLLESPITHEYTINYWLLSARDPSHSFDIASQFKLLFGSK